MNMPYIQSELFRELVGIETLLKPEYEIIIYRAGEYMEAILVSTQNDYNEHWNFAASEITTPSQITAEINRIWNAIPAECKKPNTWV